VYKRQDFVAVAGGDWHHSLGLKAGGSIVAWGYNGEGQCDVPAPNEAFAAVAGGRNHSLGLKADGSIVAWGLNHRGQCDVPAPNTDFVAVAAGEHHSLGLKARCHTGDEEIKKVVAKTKCKKGEVEGTIVQVKLTGGNGDGGYCVTIQETDDQSCGNLDKKGKATVKFIDVLDPGDYTAKVDWDCGATASEEFTLDSC